MIRPEQTLHPQAPPAPEMASATVLLLRDGEQGEEGLEVLISQRAAASSFVPSMYVFPGGRVDAEDKTWLQHWQTLFPASWPQRTRSQALAAVRECFEEMGVLLAQDAAGLPLYAAAVAQLDRQQPLFAQLQQRGWQPAVADLAWVCDRVPPASLGRAYHTAFFYAPMPAGQTVQPDMHEQLDAVWLPVRSASPQGDAMQVATQAGLQHYPMIAPTQIYKNVPTLSPEEAADMVAQACIFKPVRIATRLGILGQVLHALVPRVAQIVMNTSFRMFPDSAAAQGGKDAKPQLSAEAVALQQMMRGIHF